jgi:mannosyltransferase OCH1-like enzyme
MYPFLLLGVVIIFLGLYYYQSKKEHFTNVLLDEKIPRKIIQTWKTKTLDNVIHHTCQKRVKELHPDYEYIFFDDDEMFQFMKTNFPQYWTQFKNLRYKIQQIDFFRLCAVYYYGGIYLDLDTWLFKPLDDILVMGDLIFPAEFKVSPSECKTWKRKLRFMGLDKCETQTKNVFTVGNYGLAASKENPTLKKIIEIILADYDETMETLEETKRYHLMVYCTTGPDKITEIYYQHPDIQKKMTILSDPSTRKCCRFGEYGKHVCTGSWKPTSESKKPTVTI